MRGSEFTDRRIGPIARRIGWLTLFVGHMPPLLATLGDGRLSSALILLLSQAFFLLKLLDVRWLRLPPGVRPMMAFALVVLLLHAPVLKRASDHAEQPLTWQAVVLTGGAVLTLGFLGRWRFGALSPRRVRCADRAALTLRTRLALAAALPPRFLLFIRRLSVHRAPPPCAC